MSKDKFREVKWSPEEVARYWAYRGTQASHKSTSFGYHSGRIALRHFARHVSFVNQEVLDYGSGPGYLFPQLKAFGVSGVTAIDFSPESIASNIAMNAGDAVFRKGLTVEAHAASESANSYDVVIAMEVLEHLNDADLKETMQAFKRFLKPGGMLLLTTPNREELDSAKFACPCCGSVFNIWQHVRSFSVESMSDLLRSHGFEVVTSREAYFLPTRSYMFQMIKDSFKKVIGRPLYRPNLYAVGRLPE